MAYIHFGDDRISSTIEEFHKYKYKGQWNFVGLDADNSVTYVVLKCGDSILRIELDLFERQYLKDCLQVV
jgi:hypothetical protein